MTNLQAIILSVVGGIIIGTIIDTAINVKEIKENTHVLSEANKKNVELIEQLSYAKEGREYLLEVATHFHCMQPRQKDIRDCLMSIQQ